MYSSSASQHNQSVLFFKGIELVKELHFSEFESVLDGAVALSTFANQKACAIYLELNTHLQVTAAVFFTIGFDHDGIADSRWSIPLQDLAHGSAKGPDLGAGPIALACRSQCSINWHQPKLWDPEMSPGNNHFVLIKKALKRNRLGFEVELPASELEPSPAKSMNETQVQRVLHLNTQFNEDLKLQHEKELRVRLAHVIKEQRLRVTTLKNQHNTELQNIKQNTNERIHNLRMELLDATQTVQDESDKNHQLKARVDDQAHKIRELRQYFENKLEHNKSHELSELQQLRDNHHLELDTQVELTTRTLKEALKLKSGDLTRLKIKNSSQQNEIEYLNAENEQLLRNSGDQLLDKLNASGITLVSHQDGIGHVAVAMDEVGDYLANTEAYLAHKSGVSLSVYQQWLAHYRQPKCCAWQTGGNHCGCSINRVDDPRDFLVGESDRCNLHKNSATQIMRAVT